MSDEVKANYAQLRQLYSKFKQQADAIFQMRQKVNQSMSNLQGNWVGEGSGAFFKEMNDDVLPATNRLNQSLEEAASMTAKIAQTLKQAEQEAAAPFTIMEIKVRIG